METKNPSTRMCGDYSTKVVGRSMSKGYNNFLVLSVCVMNARPKIQEVLIVFHF